MSDRDIVEEEMAADSKIEPPPRDGTPSSIESSPENDQDPEPSQEPAQPQKRKGGRKPIYATSEERKQRNRQAQAAFRERRTEYIKQLEATIKQNEETLSTLQQSHRSAADECLMLRYKNSLLERILLEKGIDVRAELEMKTGSPTLAFQHPAANIPQIPPQPQLQRTAMQRHHARRSGQNFSPKLAPGQTAQDASFQLSPHGHPTPPSHLSSPTNVSTRSPLVMQQGGNTPPTSGVLTQPQAQHFQPFPRSSQQPPSQAFYQRSQISPNTKRPNPPHHYQSNASVVSSHSTGSRHSLGGSAGPGANAHPTPGSSASQYYPSPFQNHINQLEQEYDTQASRSMLDQPDADDNSDPMPDQIPTSYPPHFDRMEQPPSSGYYQESVGGPAQMPPPPSASETSSGPFANEMIDPNDPMLDADPFGLSASMHYPTSYSFEQPVQR